MRKRSYIQGHEGHPHYISEPSLQQLKKRFADVDRHEDFLTVLRNLSEPTKLRIYMLLHDVEEIPVTDICHVLSLSQSAVSHALSDLKKLNLIESHRCGQLICYGLKKQPKKRNALLTLLKKIFS